MSRKALYVVTGIIFLFSTLGFASAETLELLTWKGYAPKNLVDKFQEETGITVKVTYTNNEEMIAKLRATRVADSTWPSPARTGFHQSRPSTIFTNPSICPR